MKNKLILILRLIAAIILLQTLFFKFSGAEESKYIFSTLGVEPWGRWFAGGSELVASLFLIWQSTAVIGAFISVGIMAGAILSHLLILGVVVQNDGGLLFALAWVVMLASLTILWLEKQKLLDIIERVKKLRK